jgi:hypothetical protein
MATTTCKYFDSKDTADIRQGCCGICKNYDGVKLECMVKYAVIAWMRTQHWGGDHELEKRHQNLHGTI